MNAKTITRRALSVAIAIAVILMSVSAIDRWHYSRPSIPDVNTEGLDAEVVAVLNEARGRVQSEPRSAEAWGHYGLVAFAHQKFAESIPLFLNAEQRDPADFRWPFFRGLALKFEHPDECISALQHALELKPNQSNVKLRLAEILLELDRPDEAELLFRALLANRAEQSRAELGLGKILAQRGHWNEAIDLLKRAAGSPTSQKSAHTAMSQVYLRMNQLEEADAERTMAESLPADQAWQDPLLAQAEKLRTGLMPRLDRVEAQIAQGDLDHAMENLRQIARDHPESDRALLRLAKLQIQLNKLDDAQIALETTLRTIPHHSEAHFLLAAIHMYRKEFESAEADYLHAIADKPTFGLAHYNLGLCRLKRGNSAGAEEAFRAGIRTRSDLAPPHQALGKLLLEQGRRAEAIIALENAGRLDPANTETKSLLEQAKQK